MRVYPGREGVVCGGFKTGRRLRAGLVGLPQDCMCSLVVLLLSLFRLSPRLTYSPCPKPID